MPFELTFVLPKIALFYSGVTVYHTYIGNMLRGGESSRMFTLHPKNHKHKFSAMVNSSQIGKDPITCIKEMIDYGIETYTTFDTESGEYLIYRTYEALVANDQLLGKFFSSMHRNFYHRKDSNISNMAQEIMDDREMSDMLRQLGGLYGLKDKSIEEILQFLARNRIVHLLLLMYYDSGASVVDICAKFDLEHYDKAQTVIDAWRVLMQVLEKLAGSTE